MSFVEIAGVTFSLLNVTLTVHRSIWCWPVGIAGVLAYLLLFYEVKLYADMGLQVIFLVQCIYGWVYWAKKGDHGEEPPIRTLSSRARIGVAVTVLIMVGSLGAFLESATDASLPYLDSLLASMSLIANGLLARKIIDNWIIWISADVLYVGMFLYKGLMLTAGLYLIFLFLATQGFLKWRDEYKKIQARDGARKIPATT